MAQIFRQKATELASALSDNKSSPQRDSTRQALRGLIDRIVIPPCDGLHQVVGNLWETLTAAGSRTGVAAVGDDGCGGALPSMPTAVYIVAA